mmetsp:Transcript_21175/g.31178  ORF Transcript_21175/g.31178 Transcript_21175/m.31178 type:complete len:420 (-) Transcript_21175:2661-3920(-)
MRCESLPNPQTQLPLQVFAITLVIFAIAVMSRTTTIYMVTASTAHVPNNSNGGGKGRFSSVNPSAFMGVPSKIQREDRNVATTFSPSFISLFPRQKKNPRFLRPLATHTPKHGANDSPSYPSVPSNLTTDVYTNMVQEKETAFQKESSKENKVETDNSNNVTATETQLDYVGAGTLGDIMSLPEENDGTKKNPLMSDQAKFNGTATVKCFENGGEGFPTSKATTIPHWTSNVTETSKLLPPSSAYLPKDSISNLPISKQSGITTQNSPTTQPSPTKSGLVTQAGGTLTSRFKHKITNLSRLDRIALTANGNLQRIFSSYYDAPVFVHVDLCIPRTKEKKEYDETSLMTTEGKEEKKPQMNIKKKQPPSFIVSRSSSADSDGIVNGRRDCAKDIGTPTVWDRVVHLSVHDQVRVIFHSKS